MNICHFSGRIAAFPKLQSDKRGNLYCDIRLAIAKIPRNYKSTQPLRKIENYVDAYGNARQRIVERTRDGNVDLSKECPDPNKDLHAFHEYVQAKYCNTKPLINVMYMNIRAYGNKAYQLAKYGRVGRTVIAVCEYSVCTFMCDDNRKRKSHMFKLKSFEWGDKSKDIFPEKNK